MSFWNCVDDAMNDDEVRASRQFGEEAQRMWREKSDQYERYGYARDTAEGLAAEDVKAYFKRKAGEDRHVYISKIASLRKMKAEVDNAATPNMRTKVENIDYKHRALLRRFNGMLGEFLKEHSRDIAGRVKNPAGLRDIVRELHGEASGNASARALAQSVRNALEDMRIMFNDAGGLIGKLDNWGLPHIHNRQAVTRAGFNKWFENIHERIDWPRMDDYLTGKPFQREGGPPPPLEVQQRIMKEIYENIAFGKGSREVVYGRPKGQAMYKKHSEERILHFKTADDWMEYNRLFGSGDPFKSLMNHTHRMARDIVMMREFGPNPGLGAEYYQQLWLNKTRDTAQFTNATGDTNHGLRMFKVLSGSPMADSAMQDWIATFMSSARHVMTSAFLDRAVIASMSDMNTMRLAAQSMGMNPGNLIGKQIGALQSLSREELLRAGWVADTMSDAGTALARFQQEVAPADVAERLSSASMRAQGLSQWTDRARATFYQEFSGLLASQAGRTINDVDEPLRSLLRKHGVSEDDWRAFTDPETFFRADNGATFAMPLYWREATSLDRKRADEIFFKMQGIAEEQMEIAVPTQSILARSFVDPAAYDMPPGSIGYEVIKSGLMFKSFAMTFTLNQYRQLMAQPTIPGRIGYAFNLAAGATVMGALALQINDVLLGRDPQNMSPMDHPMFWARAAMKGGAFGIIGDIVSMGQASWGGGFASYVAGPVPQAVGDVWNLTFKNAYEFATGADTHFAEDVARFGKRYTPMGQTPVIGPALDRLFWDQLQLWLDPDSANALAKATKKTDNLYGRGTWWQPGDPLPSRGPDLLNAIGQ